MPLVAIILAWESDFETYKQVSEIQFSCHDPAQFDASIASRLALIIGLDQGIQFVRVQVHFNSFHNN